MVKVHHMARKLLNISEYVQKDLQQATAEQVTDLIRMTDEVDQVRKSISVMNRDIRLCF